MRKQQVKEAFSIGDLVWVPQNTEVQKSYTWMNGFGYYPGDLTDSPLHGIVVDKFNDALDTEYIAMAVSWKEKRIVCRKDDVFLLRERE
jgi:hypothetical protein